MSATMSSSSQVSTFVWSQIKRIGPLGAIILLHAGFFIALKSGLIHQVTQAMPKEVFATFITPEQAAHPTPPKPQPVTKTVRIVEKHIAPPRPAQVVVDTTPSTQAISVPVAVPSPPQEEYIPPAPASIAAPAAPAVPRTISSGVEYIRPPSPEYPAAAKRMGEEGKVLMRVLINEKGRAERVEIQKSSGSARLDDAARQALMRALFKPYMENGRALPVYAIVPINFQLSN